MPVLMILLVIILSYILGSIPWGIVVVRLFTGKDVRQIGSGRTGGTNVMRAAGLFAGLMTAGLDVMKGVASGWIADALIPGNPWIKVLAAVIALLASTKSIFYTERDEQGKLHFKGGAGGATGLGAAIALWPLSVVIIFPVAALVFVLVGYASVTTISVAVAATIIFAVRAVAVDAPWQYVVYGILAVAICLYALRPNLKRLREGTERVVGLRAYYLKRANQHQ
jgi:acyl phosphate:glycerol-3-phosphate acyltransferase